jgi:hypothetical protein
MSPSTAFAESCASSVLLSGNALVTTSPRRPHRGARSRPYSLAISMSANRPSASDGAASWRDELRMLLDPRVSLEQKSTLAQDMAKRAPEISQEAFDDICKSAGLEGVPDVARQLTDDILPDLRQNGPRYIAELGRRFPDAVNDAVAVAQQQQKSGGSSSPQSKQSPAEFVASVKQELRNVFNRTPEGLETPSYKTIATRDAYQLREYDSFLVAQTAMPGSVSPSVAASEGDSANAMGSSFNTLAKYLFGKNTTGQPMEMTTPVVIERQADSSTMGFIVPSKFGADPVSVPQPISTVSDSVKIVSRPRVVIAAAEFSGYTTAGEVERQRKKLLAALQRDGVSVVGGKMDYSVLIYNGPTTVAYMRRNEFCFRVNLDDGKPVEENAGVSESVLEQPASYIEYIEVEGTTD